MIDVYLGWRKNGHGHGALALLSSRAPNTLHVIPPNILTAMTISVGLGSPFFQETLFARFSWRALKFVASSQRINPTTFIINTQLQHAPLLVDALPSLILPSDVLNSGEWTLVFIHCCRWLGLRSLRAINRMQRFRSIFLIIPTTPL